MTLAHFGDIIQHLMSDTASNQHALRVTQNASLSTDAARLDMSNKAIVFTSSKLKPCAHVFVLQGRIAAGYLLLCGSAVTYY